MMVKRTIQVPEKRVFEEEVMKAVEVEEQITEMIQVPVKKITVVREPKIVYVKVPNPPCHWHHKMHSHYVGPGEEEHTHEIPNE